jgi:hypothetical protein
VNQAPNKPEHTKSTERQKRCSIAIHFTVGLVPVLAASKSSRGSCGSKLATFAEHADNKSAMTSERRNSVCSANAKGELPHSDAATVDLHPTRPAVRFSLRHLFWLVTAACIFLAIMASSQEGSFAAIALLMTIAVVLLHLLSTAVGTRLRAQSDEQLAPFRPFDVTGLTSAQLSQTALDGSESRSPLHIRGMSLRWLPMLIVAGALAGGCLGALLLELTIGSRTTMAGVAVGALSSAVLGGWFAFVGGSFSAIIRQGWRDALADPKIN